MRRTKSDAPTCWLRLGVLSALIGLSIGCAPDEPRSEPASQAVEIAPPRPPAPAGYAVYRNERHDYEVAYPESLLTPIGQPQSVDGQHFSSDDSSIVLTAIGRELALTDSIALLFEERLATRRTEEGVITYSSRGDSAFVISGTAGDRIYYEESVFHDDTMARIELTYPIGFGLALDSLVANVSSSFAIHPVAPPTD